MSASPRGGKNEDDIKRRQQAAPQHGPLGPQQPSLSKEASDMVKNKAMNSAVDKGSNMAMDSAKPYMQGVKNAFNPMGAAGAGPVAGQAATNAALANAGMTGGAEIALAGQTLAPSLAATGVGTGVATGVGTGVATGVGTGVATGVGAGAGMAALGTAVPYIGAAMLAGKALGWFNEGGQVGPLNPQYRMSGGPLGMGVLSMYQDMMKNNMR